MSVYGTDIRRDETAGVDHITIYHRRRGKPLYFTCPHCDTTHPVEGELLEEARESSVWAECPMCQEVIHFDESDLEMRAYIRLGAVEIGEWGE